MSLVLEAMELQRLLLRPKELADVQPEQFANPEIQRVVQGLKQTPPDTAHLKAFLAGHGCFFDGGRAVDAIRDAVRRKALNKRHETFEKRAQYELTLCRGNPDAFARTLERLQRESRALNGARE